ncbi:MAG TPA: SH3 domain-containing protein [Acidimicrobiia bacterium]
MRVWMMNPHVVQAWIEGLGLAVKPGAGTSGTELWVTPADTDGPSLVVRQRDAGMWEVVNERVISASTAGSAWQAPWDTGSPTAVVDNIARQVACGFLLVESATRDESGNLTVRFRAPVYEEGLTRQAFVLTASSVLKAARAFDLVIAQRAEELKALQDFDAQAEQRAKEQQELIDQMSPAPAAQPTAPMAAVPPTPSAAASVAASVAAPATSAPAAAWAPTHEMKRRAQAWAQPDPNAAVAGTVEKRVPVQILERRGDWAHIKCSNGWSAWIDARGLKPH